MGVLSQLNDPVFKYFEELTRIPRGSGNEQEVSDYLVKFGKSLGLETKQDQYKNVLIVKEASPGYENHGSVVLQGHTDMVCEKSKESRIDFSKDPISISISGDFIKAEDTTLGADDGIGVAIAMDILADKSLKHPRIEALFTATEETGMDGAIGLSKDWLKADKLINIDTEEDNNIIVGCAGGIGIYLDEEVKYVEDTSLRLVKISLDGLKGGHSGMKIGESHLNAIKLVTGVLIKLKTKLGLELVSFEGGTKHNAIPSQAKVLIAISQDKLEELKNEFNLIAKEIKEQHIKRETNLSFNIEEAGLSQRYVESSIASKFFRLMQLLPHGVNTFSKEREMVQSSNNLAIVKLDEGRLDVAISVRSSFKADMDDLVAKIEAVADDLDVNFRKSDGYPMWTPDFNSDLLKIAAKTYKELRGEEVKIDTIHAGLETGIISEKYPNMSMISLGPNVFGAHTPGERVSISSTRFVSNFVKKILEQI